MLVFGRNRALQGGRIVFATLARVQMQLPRAYPFSEFSIPVHEHPCHAQKGNAQAQERPEDFYAESPERAEVEGMHEPEKPIAESAVIAVVPDGEDVAGVPVEGDDVAMRKVSGRAQIGVNRDLAARFSGEADAAQVSGSNARQCGDDVVEWHDGGAELGVRCSGRFHSCKGRNEIDHGT